MQMGSVVEIFGNGIIIILQINLKNGVEPEKERIFFYANKREECFDSGSRSWLLQP